MIEHLPPYISIVFVITSMLTLLIFYWTVRHSREKRYQEHAGKIAMTLVAWLSFQAILSFNNIYSQDISSIPPKIFLFGVLPNILVMFWLFFSYKGKKFIDSLPIEKLTCLNLVRIPVEFVLLWLFLNDAIPKILTFEGWNFDIIMGITAPIVIYYGLIKQKINRKIILAWNMVGLLLLVFVFTLAFLSAPFPMQKLAFEQANIGLLYFPFSWLPSFIVPIVILGHLISIRQIMYKENIENFKYQSI